MAERSELFPLKESGTGLRIERRGSEAMSHEVLFEEDYVHMAQDQVFVGSALSRRRFLIGGAVLGLLVAVLLGRAAWMQVFQVGHFREQAEDNRLRHVYIPARRGIIRDASGQVLAENVPSFDLQAMPWLLPQDQDKRDGLLGKVSRILGTPLAGLYSAMASSTGPGEVLTLVRDVPYDQAIAIQIAVGDDPALQMIVGSKRHYTSSDAVESLSHVLGYVGAISQQELDRHKSEGYKLVDSFGKSGVEATYEKTLRGSPGEKVYEVDSLNRVTSLVGDTAPQDGADLKLTIDFNLQQAAEQALRKELEKTKLTKGAVVAMDPRDGSIRALVSWPAYDDNFFSGSVSSTYYAKLLADGDHPLLARAWSGVYPSGSTVKPVVATAALAEKVITDRTTVNSVGGLRLGQTFFPDWKAGGHGITNVRKAIAWSVNTFFYTIGGGYEGFVGLGIDRLTKWMRAFGLGSELGLDLPGESSGFVPSQEWKQQTKGERWYTGDTYNLSIGQGDLLVTPLQVASYTSTVANGGYVVRPHVGPSELVGETKAPAPVADPSVIQIVRQGMRDTVVYGSGKALSDLPFAAAGKTGTAQWRNDRPNHAWFSAFAPFDNPEIVVVVLVEEGNEGSTVSVPVAKEVLQAWWRSKSGAK